MAYAPHPLLLAAARSSSSDDDDGGGKDRGPQGPHYGRKAAEALFRPPVGSDAARAPLLRPGGIQLGVLMGAGSTGRVYAGERGQRRRRMHAHGVW